MALNSRAVDGAAVFRPDFQTSATVDGTPGMAGCSKAGTHESEAFSIVKTYRSFVRPTRRDFSIWAAGAPGPSRD
eukprot:scaffold912_cov108-Isochrysis_galbana.AAC.21